MTEPHEKLVLIVEDDETIVELLNFAIEKDGFRILIARNGNDALGLIKRSPPDLIVLDMMLPGKGGFEIIKLLQNEDNRNIPVIVTTGRFVDNKVQSMMQFEPNVKEFMTKPLNMHFLIHRIHSLLGTVSPEEKKVADRENKFRETQ